MDRVVERVNWRWGTDTWAPIVYRKEHFGPVDMIALHRLAHFGVVSSLHDGMNLVAKEFVASRTDEDGVLLLSLFTGSARELTDALLVNPFAVDQIAEAMRCALEMPPEERRRRMRATWLSRRDCAELIARAIDADDVGWAVVYGISDNPRQFWSLRSARELLGYEPRDRAPE